MREKIIHSVLELKDTTRNYQPLIRRIELRLAAWYTNTCNSKYPVITQQYFFYV